MIAIRSRTETAPRSAAPERQVLLAIVKRSLRDHRRSPLTWGVPLGLMCALELAIYPSVEKSLHKMIQSYPDVLKQAFRIERMDTPAQFLNGEMFSLIVPLAIAFFAIRAATRPVAGAEERHWLDVVLTAPVRRRTLIAGAFIGSALASAIVLLVMSALTWIAGEISGAVIPLWDILAAAAAVWPLALFFAGFALLMTGRIGNWGVVTGTAAGVLVAMYAVDIATRVSSAIDFLQPLEVFHYYSSALVSGLDWGDLGVLSACSVLFTAAAVLLFERRDIRG